jgi:CRISPR-associated protein Csd1
MILTQLYEYAKRMDAKAQTPSMYNWTRIRWQIDIRADGTLIGLTDLRGDTKADVRGKEYAVPSLVRAAKIKPKLLADNGEYVLGLSKEGADLKKVAERHQQFKDLVFKCADQTQEPSVEAIAQFLKTWNPEAFTQDDFDPADNLTFAVHGLRADAVIPANADENLTSIQQFWAAETAGEDSLLMDCLVTGAKNVPVEARLPVKIRGIPGGQTAGTSLVSANAAPFTSYGLENSLTSPMSRDAAEGFGKALNHLIADEDSHWTCPPLVYTFWTKEPVAYSFGRSFKKDQPKTIKDLLRSAQTGDRQFGSKTNRFYGLSLSASGGRAVVRSWLEVTVSEAAAALEQWFDAQEIVNEYGQIEEYPYLSIKRLAYSMYRDPPKEMEANVPTVLIEAALHGGEVSGVLLARAVRRNSIERHVTYDRAALIKLILTTQLRTIDHNPMENMQALNLNPEFDGLEPNEKRTCQMAYHCGRMLAHLANIQEAAQGRDLNATLIDRYYGAAATTPSKILGALVQDAQAHLTKLRKTKRPVYEALQQRMEEISMRLEPDKLPRTLTLQQQSIFALGYYHQRADNRSQAIARKAEKKTEAQEN